jgi:lysyl-tRNA synthetase class 2
MDQIEEFLQFTSAAMIPHLASCGIDDKPWRSPVKLTRISVYEAFRRFANVTLIDEDPSLAQKARGVGVISPREDDDFETAFFKILIEKIEPKIAALGPVILYDYPPSQAALAAVKGERAKRCEVYFGRVELSNGFEELTDPEANLSRFTAVYRKRASLGLENPPIDPDFMTALHHSFIPSCGNALGFDRWLAILCQANDLDQVIPFRKAAAYSSKTSET